MRARKAERCLQRAAAALENRSVAEVSDALDEARQLDPANARLHELTAQLEALTNPPPELPAPHHRGWAGVAVAFGLAVLSIAGWEAWAHKDRLVALFPQSRPDIDTNIGLAANVPSPASDSSPPTASPVAETALVDREAVAPSAPTPTEPTASSTPPDAIAAAKPPQAPIGTPSQIETSKVPSAPQRDADVLGHRDVASAGQRSVDATPQRDIGAAQPRDVAAAPRREPKSPALQYAPPASLPAPSTSDATNFIPAVMPSLDSGKTANPSPEPSAPPAVSSPPPPAPVPSSPTQDQGAAIRAALGRYEAAYNRLDVDGVSSVWPSLDRRALSRAFDGLTSQRVSLRTCKVDVNGTTAHANCLGSASWTPKVGGGQRTAARTWTFDLSESDGAWRINRVQAR